MRTIRGIARGKPDRAKIVKERIAELRDLIEQAEKELEHLELEYDELSTTADMDKLCLAA